MPLFDSLSAGASHIVRLAKMTSIPTTDDLRYALDEAKKRHKPVELPFEHPHNRQSFLIRVQLGTHTAPPTWTFLRGDGASAKILWARPTLEVMTIQNKISTESNRQETPQQVPDYGYAPGPVEQGPNASGDHAVYQSEPQPLKQNLSHQINPFDNLGAQPPSFFAASQSKQNMPAAQPVPEAIPAQRPEAAEPLPEPYATSQPTEPSAIPVAAPPLMVPAASAGVEPDPVPSVAAAQAQMPVAASPPSGPFSIDWSGAKVIHALLSDASTGFMSLESVAYFLLRSWEHFQKERAPFSVVVYQIAIRYPEGNIVALPPEALLPLSGRLQSACSPLDIMAHIEAGEFIVVLPSANSASALEFCRRLYTVLTETPLLPSEQGQDLALICIGAASLPEHSPDPDALVNSARQAKERAKQANSAFMLAS